MTLRSASVFCLLCLLVAAPTPAKAQAAEPPSAPSDLTSQDPLDVEVPESDDDINEDPAEKNLFERLPRHKVQESLERVLKQDLPFCSRSDYKARHDPELCKLSKAELQRCAALKKTCEAAEPAPKDRDFSAFKWLAPIADVLFWGVILALVAVLIIALARVLANFAKERAESEESRDESAPPDTGLATQARLPRETDVDRLLSRARAAANAARYDEAIGFVHAALVHALGSAGHIQVDPARTNGDYLRELRAHPELYAPVREVLRGIEGVQFGGRSASLELFERLIERVLPILKTAVALCLLIVSMNCACACSPVETEHPEQAPRGYHVLTTLLAENGTKVRRRIREIGTIDSDVAEVLAVGEVNAEALERLLEWVNQGGSLTITTPLTQVEKASRIEFNGGPCSGKLELGPGFESAKLKLSALGSSTLAIRGPVDEGSFHWVTATCDGRPYVASTAHGDGTITVIAESELFTNASLSIADNAYFAVSLLSSPGSSLEIVGPWTGGGASSPFASLQNAGLGPTLLELGLFALLLAWSYGTAFGKRRDPLRLARRAFVEHVRALGAMYARARASRFALASYGAWAIDRLRERTAPGEAIGVIDLASAVARKTSVPEAEVVQLLAEARHAQESAATEARSPQDLQTLQRLEALVFRTGGNQ